MMGSPNIANYEQKVVLQVALYLRYNNSIIIELMKR